MRQMLGVRVESPAFDAGTVQVAELSGKESISRLFELELRLALRSGELDEEKLLTSPATVVFERRETADGPAVETRRITGTVSSIVDRALRGTRHREYVVTLVPRAWRATLSLTSDVCMDLSVPDIIVKKLAEGASLDPKKDVELRLKSSYATREFVVQYKESHFDFVNRLAEDLGIHYFFEEGDDGRDVLVLADDNGAFKKGAPGSAPFSAGGELTDVYELEARRRLVTTTFAARDYNYRNPGMDLLGEAKIGALGLGKYDEYGPHAKTPEEISFYAKIRAEEAQARSLVFEGRSDMPGLRAGSVLVVEGHPRGELELVVTEVEHSIAQNVFGFGETVDRPYENVFRAIPRSVPFRPARVTPKPVVHGVVTGIVESESPTSLGAIDEMGRYRVAFLYDSVTGRGDGKASRPLRMAQPSAGSTRGFHLPLKPGTEVIITCVNGDPDRPIIAGAVPNPQTPSPVTSANAEKSIWTTNVNSIAIDDDKPRCKVSVADGAHVVQIGEPNGPELGVLIDSVDNVTDRAKKVKSSYSAAEAAFTDQRTGTASKDILQAAGIPSPMSVWDKIQNAAKAVADFAASISDMADGVADMFEYGVQDAKAAKEEADAAIDEAKKAAFEGMNVKAKASPKPVSDGRGGARYETKEEAEARTYAEELAKPENANFKAGIDEAMKGSAEAGKAVEEAEKQTAGHATREVTKEVTDFLQDVEDVGEDLEENYAKLKKYGKYLPGLGKYLENLPAADKLVSKISSIFAKTTHRALDAVVSGAQKASAAIPKVSGERKPADAGSFSKPYNIQLSRHSAALFGSRNAFVFGGKNASMVSAVAATVFGRRRVDVKSTALVEVAAKDVFVSSKKECDVYSKGTVSIVGGTPMKMPADSSVLVQGSKDAHFMSDDKSVHIKAFKNVSVFARNENLTLTAKKDLLALTTDGKFELEAAKGTGKIATKQKLEVKSADDLAVLSEKNATIRAKQALKLNAKEGAFKVEGDLQVKAKKVSVKAGKIELG